MNNLDTLLDKMREYADKNNIPIIQPESAGLLVNIVSKFKPYSILEIGSAIGYSTLLIAANTRSDASIISIEIESDRLEIARNFVSQSGIGHAIRFVRGDAIEIIPALGEKFDMVFIDAAKGQYIKYLSLVQPKLKTDAIIVADNVLFRGYVRSSDKPPKRYGTIVKRLRQYLKYVTEHPDFSTEIFDTGDGMAVSYFKGAK